MIAVVKLGISCSYQIIYISHCELFPTLFAATAIGWLQFGSCLVGGSGPFIVAVTEEPTISFVILTALAAITAVLVLFLVNDAEKEKQKKVK